MVISIPVVFYLSTRQYSSWSAVKERWFRAGIENGLLFSSGVTDGKEALQLKGEYSGCVISLSTYKSRTLSGSTVKVALPEVLAQHLGDYSIDVLAAFVDTIERVLNTDLGEQAYQLKLGDTGRRLNPLIVEQLIALREGYFKQGRRFRFGEAAILYEQDTIAVDPALLFPVLDELVVLVNLMAANTGYLLVK